MRKIFICLIFFLFSVTGFSQNAIIRIDIEGNKIVSDAKIISKIKIRAGHEYNDNIINEDIKNLYGTGFFDNIEVEKKEDAEGVVVVFKLEEKPVLKSLVIQGARVIPKRKIIDSIDIKEGAFIDEYKLKEASAKIKDLYDTKGFYQTEVTYEMEFISDRNEIEARFLIDEKKLVKIRKVDIKGNKTISTARVLRLMKTKKAWLLNRGVFKEGVLEDDTKRISEFYKLEGFGDVGVETEINPYKNGVAVTVNINEGDRYYIGEIKIEGSKNISLQEIDEAKKLKSGDVFSEQAIYEDSSKIREVYMNKGYIFSQVEPFSYFNLETQRIDVTYKIVENEVAYIEMINIKGNVRTKDEVVRRELRVFPMDKFDGEKVRRSKERLENLGFFEEIRLGTEPGSKPNWIDLVVDVKEAKTGYLSFGGGYSSIDEFLGFVELRQRNFDYKNFSTFTGAGQDLSINASFGTVSEQYQLSFTNPWIFNQPISFGFDGYKKGHSREQDVGYAYEEEIRGGVLRLGKEFSDHLRGGLKYRYERVDIGDIVDDASQDLKDEKGVNNLSSGEISASYDTRNNVFSPSRGVFLSNNFQVTGGPFGGDKDFLKYMARLSLYFPMAQKSVIEWRTRCGVADPFSNTEKVPIYERFFAGGASTIRGYHERKIGPIDDSTEDPLGGESMFVSNVEYTYPLADFIKVATFFDTGNVWTEFNDFLSGGLKSSVGLGMRVKTPIGPVSVDYGWPLNLEPGEDGKEGRFHFSVSRGF
jgi:outer membrane protein insertion porin family